MIAIREEIDRGRGGGVDAGGLAAARCAAHLARSLTGDWDRAYSRETAAFPAGYDPDKYWPPVGADRPGLRRPQPGVRVPAARRVRGALMSLTPTRGAAARCRARARAGDRAAAVGGRRRGARRDLVWTGALSVLDGSRPGRTCSTGSARSPRRWSRCSCCSCGTRACSELNDPLSKHLPGVAFGDQTLRDLLSHAAGMSAEPAGSWWERSPGRSFDELAAALDEESAPFETGRDLPLHERRFALLGEVVARHRGTSWWSAAQERILDAARHDAARATCPRSRTPRGSACTTSPAR